MRYKVVGIYKLFVILKKTNENQKHRALAGSFIER